MFSFVKLSFIIVVFFPLFVFSQENNIDTVITKPKVKENYFDQYINQIQTRKTTEGQVNIMQDNRIKSLMNKQIRIDDKNPGFAGYRVQIFFDSGSQARTKANEVKSKFLTLYPDVAAYLTYEQPFFKIRVGDFRNMLEAQGFKNVLSTDFSNAFIVSDKINGY